MNEIRQPTMTRERFEIKSKLGEGSFAVVLLAYDTQRKCEVAIKCIKDRFQSLEEAMENPEIQIFRCLEKHPNIVNLLEVLFCKKKGKLSLVFEYVDASLYDFILDESLHRRLTENDMRFIFFQIANGIGHLHSAGVFHRDIKPENILINKATLQIKIADFGCCKGIYDEAELTEYISTRWYRPPECAILYGFYGKSMDVWAMACVFFEVLTTEPLFPGRNEFDQVSVIHSVIGSPDAKLLKFFLQYDYNEGVDFNYQKGVGIRKYMRRFSSISQFGDFEMQLVRLLEKMLEYDPRQRISSEEILKQSLFQGLNVSQKYQQFSKKAETFRALELVHRLLNRPSAKKKDTLDLLASSLNIFNSSKGSKASTSLKTPEYLGLPQKLDHKLSITGSIIDRKHNHFDSAQEKLIRSVCQEKTINQKIEIRKHFKKIEKDVMELQQLSVEPELINSILAEQKNNLCPARNPFIKGQRRRRMLAKKARRPKANVKLKGMTHHHQRNANSHNMLGQSLIRSELFEFDMAGRVGKSKSNARLKSLGKPNRSILQMSQLARSNQFDSIKGSIFSCKKEQVPQSFNNILSISKFVPASSSKTAKEVQNFPRFARQEAANLKISTLVDQPKEKPPQIFFNEKSSYLDKMQSKLVISNSFSNQILTVTNSKFIQSSGLISEFNDGLLNKQTAVRSDKQQDSWMSKAFSFNQMNEGVLSVNCLGSIAKSPLLKKQQSIEYANYMPNPSLIPTYEPSTQSKNFTTNSTFLDHNQNGFQTVLTLTEKDKSLNAKHNNSSKAKQSNERQPLTKILHLSKKNMAKLSKKKQNMHPKNSVKLAKYNQQKKISNIFISVAQIKSTTTKIRDLHK